MTSPLHERLCHPADSPAEAFPTHSACEATAKAGRLPPSSAPVVVITGTASGMGRATAAVLADQAWRVFGGDLAPRDPPPGAVSLPLDVRLDDSVAAFVECVLREAGRIDALVNNAGYALAGAVEETGLDEARAQFETNFFGATRMVRAVLPAMRRQGAGRIVNISSGAGITAGPFHAFYSASKFAVEGYSEALRHELRPLGIHVSLVQPGSFRTNVARNSKRAARRLPEYDGPRERVIAAASRYCEDAPDPVLVGRCIERVLRAPRPALRYRVGSDVRSGFWARRLLPERLFQWMVAKHYDV